MNDDLINDATRWYVLLRSGQATAGDWQRYQLWRAADPRHDALCRQLETRLGVFQIPQAQGVSGQLLQQALDAPSSRRQVLQVALVGAGVAAGATWLAKPLGVPLADLTADIRTGTGERRTVTLDDGSELSLNAQSAADIQFDPQRRLVRLREGELLAKVAGDRIRPFMIQTDQARLRAYGNRLLVRERAGQGQVVALNGAVEIDSQNGERLQLAAGHEVHYDRAGFGPVQASSSGATAWVDGFLQVRDRPLSEVIEALRPYHNGVLRLDPSVAGLRVSGLYRLDNPQQILDTLARTLPIHITRRTGLWVNVNAA
ncbi:MULTISPECIES: FecR domain-containing protein [unclassified Pseudomonas]|uniref:FecR domain-containing protein n=1 Tax=unclassified Pseudomonas TaxID=196821 RepID=UPI0008E43E80|nr:MULTISPECIES: FecR family protein [unclassified Pseudomonas]PMV19447.1 FecR family protein [Pseudomonas sp. FW305-3-2-15-C-TSA2]PMV23240.1 FecR family protein [Pseudomonas sp. DP16D-L5]PMV35568.1 FecR family protein [Pseudomonas sp. FW305-3-2-15-A-LB2]PMV40903.1 FecR family protein [Pseudomonas sp. FW305-3-2-15-C-R2A1]PMV46402.1 FecR family protein [Pseudomonas sp. FW305-3-2-15-C-LB1]